MANDAHLKQLRLGVSHWNTWRKQHFTEPPDLSGADLSGLHLDSVNLIGANLSKTNLSCAQLSGAFLSCANLSQAYLSEANLSGANLSKANLSKADLSFANLTKSTLIEADLNRATLIEATLESANLSFADLNRANLSKANLQNGNLTKTILIEATLNQANLRSCNLNQAIASEASLREATLIGARLNKADFSFANLIEANCRRANLSRIILIEANLRGANLREAILRKGNLGRANLGNTDLEGADGTDANLAGADLIKANLNRILLVGARCNEALLSGTTLQKAVLTGASLVEADLRGADLTKTDLRQANLSQAELTQAKVAATNFIGAELTGICLEDAQLSSTTKLEGVTCDFVYLKRNNQDRRPSQGQFLPGEFAQLFHSALETINLTLHSGVNWTAFAATINQLNQRHQDAQLGIQSIENKGDGVLLLKLSTAPGIDTVAIQRDFMQRYEETLQALNNRRRLSTKETLLAHHETEEGHPRDSISRLFELLSPQAPAETNNGTSQTSMAQLSQPAALTTADAATIIRTVMDDLAQRYPGATLIQRQVVTGLEFQQLAKREPKLEAKLLDAAQTGSLLIDQVLQDNAFVSVSLGELKEWLQQLNEATPLSLTVSAVSTST